MVPTPRSPKLAKEARELIDEDQDPFLEGGRVPTTLSPKLAEIIRRHGEEAHDDLYLEEGREANTYQAARAYGRCGLPVFPLYEVTADGRCACNDPDCRNVGRHPRTPNGLEDATADLDRIRDWWQRWPDASVGIATGAASVLFVLDIHGAEGRKSLEDEELPDWTPRVQSSDGVQIYFGHPGGRISSKVAIRPGVDVQADDGYVVAPPSRHPSGTTYDWLISPGPLPEAPAWLLNELKWQKPDKKRTKRRAYDWSFEALGRQPTSITEVGKRPAAHDHFEFYFSVSKPLFGTYMQTLRGLIRLAEKFYEREIELLEDQFRFLEESYDQEIQRLAGSPSGHEFVSERVRLDSEFHDHALAIARVTTARQNQLVSVFADLLTVESPPVSSNAVSTVRLYNQNCPPGSLFGDLLTIATPPVSHGAVGARRLTLVRSIRASLAQRLNLPSSTEGSANHLIMPATGRSVSPAADAQRIEAAKRVAKWIGRVIHPKRWRGVRAAIMKLAKNPWRDPEAEVRDRIVENLFEAVEVAGSYTLGEEDDVKRALRQKLTKLVTADALGPDSHRKVSRKTRKGDISLEEANVNLPVHEAALAKAQLEEEILQHIEVERRFARAKLTRAEAEVAEQVRATRAFGAEHGAIAAAARALNKNPSTVRGLWNRAKEKLAAVRE